MSRLMERHQQNRQLRTASGSDSFVTDLDEGAEKVDTSDVRLARAKRAELPPTPLPVDEPSTASNPFKLWSREVLEAAITAVSKFTEDQAAMQSLIQMTEELNRRPKPVVDQPAPAQGLTPPPAPIVASKKKATGSPSVNEEANSVSEGAAGVPEFAKAKALVDDNTGVVRPKTTLPEKLASEVTTAKAVKQAESFSERLKALYLEAKSLTSINDTRPVREAVESIFHASVAFGEATKVLNAQARAEAAEEEAAKAVDDGKGKKKASGSDAFVSDEVEAEEATPVKTASHHPLLANLKVATAAKAGTVNPNSASPSKDSSAKVGASAPKSAARSARRDREQFIVEITAHSPKTQTGEINAHAARTVSEDLLRLGATYKRIQDFLSQGAFGDTQYDPEEAANVQAEYDAQRERYEARELEVREKITALAAHLGVSPLFHGDPRFTTIKIQCPDGFTNDSAKEGIVVPTS